MAGEKKTIKSFTAGRNKEIRVRYVKPETLKALAECSAMMKEKTVPDTIVKLIHNYKNDQLLIKQLQARNTQLHAALLQMVKERLNVESFIKRFISDSSKALLKATKLQKDFSKRGTKAGR